MRVVHPLPATRAGRRPSEGQRDFARSLLLSLEPWFEKRIDIPAQYIRSFLMIALEEGLSVTEYALKAGVAKSVMSRHILDLGAQNRKREEGFGLVDYKPNPMELRRHEIYLTPKGQALLDRMKRSLETTYTRRNA